MTFFAISSFAERKLKLAYRFKKVNSGEEEQCKADKGCNK
jgi:hypothetical protein